ncbi:MAG: ANTAR domain-containing protein [Methylococcaceae bacterium]|nr:ANTAR domain-containing protein [Methylococcaceae bacterium]
MSPAYVLIIDDKTKQKELEPLIKMAGYGTFYLDQLPADISSISNVIKPDILLINSPNFSSTTLALIKNINENYPLPIVVFSDAVDKDSIARAVQAGVCAYIVDGYINKPLKTIIEIATARFTEQHKLRIELEQSKSKLQGRKLIDRAKGILMNLRHLSEDEAYHTLRKLAMERNTTMEEMAKNVIAMAELLDKK